MQISNAAIGAIAALCVTAGAAGVYVTTGGDRSAPFVPVVGAVAPASEQPVYQFNTAPPAPAVAATAPVRRVARTASPRPVGTAQQPRQQAPVAWNASPVEDVPAVAEPRKVWSEDVEPTSGDREISRRAERAPEFIELTIPADSVLGLQIETAVTSETAELEDEVVARVARDVRAGDRVVIPEGSQVRGQVTFVERGGKLRERARLGVRFTSAVLADGTRIPLMTDTVMREGSSPGGESAAKIGGGAIGGAIIGGILGGARGAVIGGSVGAGAGTTAVMVGGRNPATLPAGTAITVRLTEPSTVTVDY